MASPDIETTIREHVLGRRLSGVTFVMDYIQLQFDPPPTVNALTPVTVRCDGKTAVSGEEPFRNLLCDQIPKTVSAVQLREGQSLIFGFADGSEIELSLRASDYVCSEAVNVCDKDHFFLAI